MVGREDGILQRIYEAYRKKWHLDLPVSFDSAVFREAVPGPVPYIIWIDPKGIIKAISSSSDLVEQNLAKFIKSEPFAFKNASEGFLNLESKIIDSMELAKVTPNWDSSLLYQSMLRRPVISPMLLPASVSEWLAYSSPNKFHTMGASIIRLYQYAYADFISAIPGDSMYEKVRLMPILETLDSTRLSDGYKYGTEVYAYSVTIPRVKATTLSIQHKMQNDLKQFFGYEVHVEKRTLPCWKLITIENGKERLLKTKIDTTIYDYDQVSLNNVIMVDLIRSIFEFMRSNELILDETGISDTFDIEMKLILSDIEGMIKELNRNGLSLIRGKHEVDVIIIKDDPEAELEKNTDKYHTLQ